MLLTQVVSPKLPEWITSTTTLTVRRESLIDWDEYCGCEAHIVQSKYFGASCFNFVNPSLYSCELLPDILVIVSLSFWSSTSKIMC